ncbi:sugar kinase [Pseudooceanicola sp. CBS1P-1]|uniref:Sugar kinase n=1 Tax=Pseudooceanicola albus TaxID=2692189 RepID=A0A6L7G7U0_9RHOB|nr:MULTISPECIES: sugar kinase [Pseudooceanicola]MBT9386185.1 sugar kinase [Pseudooceanicola endophyticus]MXN19400.1 sugar kinase [Pseudooceanicola albus]
MKITSIGECMIELSGTGQPDQWRSGFAGDTFNTAWYLARLVPPGWQVSYHTQVGCDPRSEAMLAFFAAAGLGTGSIARHPTRVPGLYMIDLQDGERSFTYWRDRSAARALAQDGEALARVIAAVDVVYVSGITLAILPEAGRETLVGLLADSGRHVVFDPNLRPRLWEDGAQMRHWITRAAATARTVLPSHDDEAQHFGDADPAATARRYLGLGAREVVVKNGGGPMVLGTPQGITALPPLPRVDPVDTTGAGDSFNAGYLARRLAGAPPGEAVAEGHRVASAVIGVRGALTPDLAPAAPVPGG